jgi:hypothetical protein
MKENMIDFADRRKDMEHVSSTDCICNRGLLYVKYLKITWLIVKKKWMRKGLRPFPLIPKLRFGGVSS